MVQALVPAWAGHLRLAMRMWGLLLRLQDLNPGLALQADKLTTGAWVSPCAAARQDHDGHDQPAGLSKVQALGVFQCDLHAKAQRAWQEPERAQLRA